MTEEELKKIPFRMISHAAWKDEHTCTYQSEDGRLGFCDHTKVLADFDGILEFGRTYRHWRIDDNVYKSKKKFLEALKDFHPEQ